MWYAPDKYNKVIPDLNSELSKLTGELGDREAKITLAKFLRSNLAFTTEILSGQKLYPYQEIVLKGMLSKNFSMNVWARGAGKSYIASIYCLLQCVFEPNTHILIAGPTFRTARFIFNYLEKIVDSKGAGLLKEAFGVKSKRNDLFEWHINGGSIKAIPLNGEKIRGFRANVLLLDEFLLLPEDLVKNVLMPFLIAPQNIRERMDTRELEDKLIKDGLLEEEDRIVFENTSKMIALSSASYTFENLYKTYQEWIAKIYDKETTEATYFVSQLSYEALPPDMVDKNIIEEARSGGSSNASFVREYCAQFTDGSDSYFSAKKMHECTIPDGQEPTIKLNGERDKKYIIAIDPSFSNSPSSDYFAMAVMELDEDSKTSTLVHNYAVAGGDLKDHIKYFDYLTDSFGAEMIIIDNAGYTFIDSCNQSDLFVKKNKEFNFFEFDSDLEGAEYEGMLKVAKRQFNKQSKAIVFKQNFSINFIRNANEYLQGAIDYKKVWFGSRISPNASAFERISSQSVKLDMAPDESVMSLIETQDDLVHQVKKQCALIEVSSTAKGSQSFDLPQHLRRSTSPTRARKDNYTALLLGNWAVKCYNDITRLKENQETFTFSPIVIR